MDPTAELVRIGVEQRKSPVQPLTFVSDTKEFDLASFESPEFKEASEIYRSEMADEYKDLQDKRDSLFSHTLFQRARDVTNPFNDIGRFLFLNRAAVKIANVDAVFNITRYPRNGAFRHSFPFRFADLCGGPGGFTQYVLWRNSEAVGGGITLKTKGLDWDTRSLDMDRFTITNGDGTGDVYNLNNCDEFVRIQNAGGNTQLVMADGGFDLDSEFHLQEIMSTRIILSQTYMALRIIEDGGDYVLKLFDTETNVMKQIVFLISSMFETITIFKPVSSRPANGERYLVCKGFQTKPWLGDVVEMFKYILEAYNGFEKEDNLHCSLLLYTIPSAKFVEFIEHANRESYSRQVSLIKDIEQYYETKKVPESRYYPQRCLSLWNLPEKM